MTVNFEYVGMWKEAVMFCFNEKVGILEGLRKITKTSIKIISLGRRSNNPQATFSGVFSFIQSIPVFD
jgi:hypothetical protein